MTRREREIDDLKRILKTNRWALEESVYDLKMIAANRVVSRGYKKITRHKRFAKLSMIELEELTYKVMHKQAVAMFASALEMVRYLVKKHGTFKAVIDHLSWLIITQRERRKTACIKRTL